MTYYNADITHCEGSNEELCQKFLRYHLAKMAKEVKHPSVPYILPEIKGDKCKSFMKKHGE